MAKWAVWYVTNYGTLHHRSRRALSAVNPGESSIFLALLALFCLTTTACGDPDVAARGLQSLLIFFSGECVLRLY